MALERIPAEREHQTRHAKHYAVRRRRKPIKG